MKSRSRQVGTLTCLAALCGGPVLVAEPLDLGDLLDLRSAVVTVSRDLRDGGSMAGVFLIEEVEKRTGLRWETSPDLSSGDCPRIWVGTEREVSELPKNVSAGFSDGFVSGRPEGYRLVVLADGPVPTVMVVGPDSRGALFGVGQLIRRLEMRPDQVLVSGSLDITTSPVLPIRGHQLGYRATPNSYDAWDTDQWEQYYRDLILFGTNAIELIPPEYPEMIAKQPNRMSTLYPRPQDEMMVEMSRLADQYELDVWIWYPAVLGDYADEAVVQRHMEGAEEVFRSLPRIDNLFVPGGDPGRTHPDVLMPFLVRNIELLRRFHPEARLWVSLQGFSIEWLGIFLDFLNTEQPEWLAGVVYGPGLFVSFEELRERIPARYPIRSYPDISHTFHCQYPIPDWDRAYALTEGREPINPRPIDQEIIFQSELPFMSGVVTYSEGCTDDVNKFIWSGLAWDPEASVMDILRDYGRVFIGREIGDDFAQGTLALERNWRGPLSSNREVRTTLEQFQELERNASPDLLGNWRFQQALYRAYYDAFIQRRLAYETELDARALDLLRQAPSSGALTAMALATDALNQAQLEPVAGDLRARVFELGDQLFHSIGLQLSVEKYHAKMINRGANLDLIDFPLCDGPWLLDHFDRIRSLPDEASRLEELRNLVEWTNPGPGGFYDDLGDSANELHLVRGPGYPEDPSFKLTAADDYELIKVPPFYREHPYRASWLNRASTRFGTPLRLHYDGLDPVAQYRVRIVYPADRDDFVPQIRMTTDDGFEVHPFLDRPIPAAPLEFTVPHEATADGEVWLELEREVTAHGNGRGAQIAEIWLLKDE